MFGGIPYFDQPLSCAWLQALTHAEPVANRISRNLASHSGAAAPALASDVRQRRRLAPGIRRRLVLLRRQLRRDSSYRELEVALCKMADVYLVTLFSYVLRKTETPVQAAERALRTFEARLDRVYREADAESIRALDDAGSGIEAMEEALFGRFLKNARSAAESFQKQGQSASVLLGPGAHPSPTT